MTTTTAADDEPEEIEYDTNGFPESPSNNQHFTDDSGQEWVYDSIFGWIEDGGENVQYEFPDHGGDYFSGEQILW